MPTVIQNKRIEGEATKLEEGKRVGFLQDPIHSFSRPVNTAESWAAYNFEMHARKCAYCHNPYEVYRNHEQLCDMGHRLAQEVARYIYNKSDGKTYSTAEEDSKLVQVELPSGYVEAKSLLRAIERSLRHRTRRPFVSMERTYYVAPRTPAASFQRSHSIKIEQPKTKPSRPRSGEVVDWPEPKFGKRKLSEINNAPNVAVKRMGESGAAHTDSMTLRTLRNYRRSGYWRDEPLQTSAPEESSERNVSTFKEVEQPDSLKHIPWDDEQDNVQFTKFGRSKEWDFTTDINSLSLGTESLPSIPDPDSHRLGRPPKTEEDYSNEDNESVFSEASIATTLTNMSVHNTFSFDQVNVATRELLSIFQECEDLQPLYTNAIYGSIGPDRFFKEFRRQLKIFAQHLKEEADDSLSLSAARLVAMKARHIAKGISERYETGLAPALGETAEDKPQLDLQQSSSDEESEHRGSIDESAFNELALVRKFWLDSEAFSVLRHEMARFVARNSVQDVVKAGESQSTNETLNIESTPPDNEHVHRYEASEIGEYVISDRDENQQANDMGADHSTERLELIRANSWFSYLLQTDDALSQLCIRSVGVLGKPAFIKEVTRIVQIAFLDGPQSSWNNQRDNREMQAAHLAEMVDYVATGQSLSGLNALCGRQEVDRMNIENESDNKMRLNDSSKSEMKSFQCEQKIKEFVDDAESNPHNIAHQIKTDIALLSLESQARDIFLSYVDGPLEISWSNDSSLKNKAKHFIEGETGLHWDWWPLSPSTPDVRKGQGRLEWTNGGIRQFYCAPLHELELLQDLINLAKPCASGCREEIDATDTLPSETIRDQLQHISANGLRILFSAASAMLSKTTDTIRDSQSPHRALTGSQHDPAPGGSVTAVSTRTNTSGTVNNTGILPSTSRQSGLGPSNLTSIPLPVQGKNTHGCQSSSRVLFAVQGSRWSLDLEQIPVTSLLNDPAFFRELKVRHLRHRSLLKRVFSPYRFNHCRFVKLEKFDIERVLSQGDDLPDHPGIKDDYEYEPRPGRNPMISPQTFAVCLKACDQKCRWKVFNPWHDCVRLPCRSYRLQAVPKKKSAFDLHSNDIGLFAWGLEAEYAVSFAIVAVYHLVPLLASFGFWIYWLVRFPNDWQNAAVPMLTVLAAFAVIWALTSSAAGSISRK